MFEFGKRDGAPEPQGVTAQRDTRREPAVPDALPGRATGKRADTAVIGPSIRIDGELRGDEDLLIEGEVRGRVRVENHTVTVGVKGRVEASIYAQTIRVEGTVTGDLFASEQVQISPTAQIRGNVTASRVTLQDGAKFKGAIEMDTQAVQAAFQIPTRISGANAEALGRTAGAARETTAREAAKEPAVKTESAPKSEGKAAPKVVSGGG